MTAWIARHAEALWEASQALRKVQKEYGSREMPSRSWTGRSPWSHSGPTYSSFSRGGSRLADTGRDDATENEKVLEEQEADPEWEKEVVASEHGSGRQDREAGDWSSWRMWHGCGWSAWSQWSGGRIWRTQEYEPPRMWDTSKKIFIPEFLAGFLLLHRAGLDTQEKANILAAIRGEFSTLSVGWVLREQWSDEDLSRRDKAKMNNAYYTAADEEEDEALTGTSTTTIPEKHILQSKNALRKREAKAVEAGPPVLPPQGHAEGEFEQQ